jgi:hypothetical protein
MGATASGGQSTGMLSTVSISPAAQPSDSFMYVETDVPPGMTLSAWRGEKVRARAPRSRTLRALRRLAQ